MHFFDDIESILDLFEDDNSIGQGNWFHQDNTANVSLEHLGSLEVYCSLDGLNCTGKELCAGSDDEKRKESKKRNGAGQVHGKARSKRVRRVWSLNSPLPLGGVSRVLPSKRSCSHCKTAETPQWRMGPLGPKTLCNACGVRYKSGRLVPEYRPAASPSFVSHLHSNSHKKIMMMRGLTK